MSAYQVKENLVGCFTFEEDEQMENLAPRMKQRFKEQLTELATKYTILESYSEQDINTMIDIVKRLEQGESEKLDIDKALEVMELIGKYSVVSKLICEFWQKHRERSGIM